MHGRPWSDRDIGELIRLRRAGLTIREIAEIVERTEIAVHSRLSLLGVHKPRFNRMYHHPMREALCRPHSLEGVAKAFGKSVPAVVSIKWRLKEAGFEVYEIPKTQKKRMVG